MNKIKSPENIFPFFPFLAGEYKLKIYPKKSAGEKTNLVQNIIHPVNQPIKIQYKSPKLLSKRIRKFWGLVQLTAQCSLPPWVINMHQFYLGSS